MKYTHTCGELREKHIGEKVTLCGWVYRRRDHGNLIFIDLRDKEGITQVVFNTKEIEELRSHAKELKAEYVVSVTGNVNKRPKGTENSHILTGHVEVVASSLSVLNISKNLPFEIDSTEEITEELRFTYRYLDLRKPNVRNIFKLRHKSIKFIRDFLDNKDFVEVETPTLTKSTPEGARDYLVPSRVNAGKFYALPQSPQLFKQILMVGGLERYFQIAKCFRDEDLRADRQPEFTQLDIEMSFIEEEDIFTLMEKLLFELFMNVLNIELKVPFPRLTYATAIKDFGTDKPDLKKSKDEFAFIWVTEFPLFRYNEEEKRWDMEHHPFTSPKEEDIELLDKDLGSIKSRAYDLVLNGVELGSGSIRIHERKLQEKILGLIGLDKSEFQKRFGFFLEALDFGAPPHGGIAIGLDRLIAILANCGNIREVIAFPKSQKAVCFLTDAPSEVPPVQLKELGLSIKK